MERLVASKLDARLTKSSGNQNHDGDMILDINNIRVECKDTGKPGNYILRKADFKKHWNDCLQKGSIPVWALRTQDMPVICVIELNEFNDLIMELERLRRERK